jgi:hypothetical protein
MVDGEMHARITAQTEAATIVVPASSFRIRILNIADPADLRRAIELHGLTE